LAVVIIGHVFLDRITEDIFFCTSPSLTKIQQRIDAWFSSRKEQISAVVHIDLVVVNSFTTSMKNV